VAALEALDPEALTAHCAVTTLSFQRPGHARGDGGVARAQAERARLEVDFHWPENDLVIEVDGAGHDRPPTRREGAERDARLELAGLEVRRVPAR
jgi:hypothetical protein